MTANTPPPPPDELLADYLNDHLPHAERARMDAALAQSTELQAQLDFARQLQTALRAEAKTADAAAAANQTNTPDFSQIADRFVVASAPSWLHRARHALGMATATSWMRTGIPVAAFACLIIGIVITQNAPTVQEFETAINSEETFHQPTLRIITTSQLSTEALEQLLQDNGLRMENRFPQGDTLDATLLNTSDDITAAAATLKNDPRIRIVKIVHAQ